MRNLQEQVKKAFCCQKLFWPFTVWINCSSDLKNFANSRPSASNFKSFSQSLKQFFLTVGQNNFGNKIQFFFSDFKLLIHQGNCHSKYGVAKSILPIMGEFFIDSFRMELWDGCWNKDVDKAWKHFFRWKKMKGYLAIQINLILFTLFYSRFMASGLEAGYTQRRRWSIWKIHEGCPE